MADECQYLEYRSLGDDSEDGRADGSETDEPGDRQFRAYCTAAQLFVQAMRADICNRRYGLDPETDCEIYRDHEGLSGASAGEGAKIDDARDSPADDAGDDRTDGARE